MVMGRILVYPVVLLACTAGRHRSVAVAEVAAAGVRPYGRRVDVAHIDLLTDSAVDVAYLHDIYERLSVMM